MTTYLCSHCGAKLPAGTNGWATCPDCGFDMDLAALHPVSELAELALADAAAYGSEVAPAKVVNFVEVYLKHRPLMAMLNDLAGFRSQLGDPAWADEMVQIAAIKREVAARCDGQH